MGPRAHQHEHPRGDVRTPNAARKTRLWIALVLGACIMATEIAAGLAANSLVLLADAAHYATDLAAVALALVALQLGEKAATHRQTFGYRRSEVLAAFVNALALWGISIYFIWEAYRRVLDPPEVGGPVVLVVGGVTLIANLGLARILHPGSHTNLNQRAAYIHVVSDAMGSAAALVAGAAIYYYGLHIADPLLTLFVTLLILAFTWRLTRQTWHILMQGAPTHLDSREIRKTMAATAGVKEVHDLHVWTLADGDHSLTAHVVLAAPPTGDTVMHGLHDMLRSKYGLAHVTLQMESPDCPCTDPSAHRA